jgi:hypothetical protein
MLCFRNLWHYDCETSLNLVVEGVGEHMWNVVDGKHLSTVMSMASKKGVNVNEKSSFVPSCTELHEVFCSSPYVY